MQYYQYYSYYKNICKTLKTHYLVFAKANLIFQHIDEQLSMAVNVTTAMYYHIIPGDPQKHAELWR